MTKKEYERMILASGGYTRDPKRGDEAWELTEAEEQALDAAWRRVAADEESYDTQDLADAA